jgi:class 3 adenylate cyclase
MEFEFYHASSVWREGRRRRIVSFIRVLCYLAILLSLNWTIVTVLNRIYLLTAATLMTALSGVAALFLLRKGRLLAAKFVILLAGLCYYLLACVFASGYGTTGGSAHFGFVALGLAAYFLLQEKRVVREVVLAGFLMLFFLFHFGYAPFHPLVVLPPGRLEFIHRMDIGLTLFLIFFITRMYVIELSRSEEALAVSADRMEGLLESMLPKSVAERMQREGKTFADEFVECSVLFADIEGFTRWSAHHSPNEVVMSLNRVFSLFDDAVERTGLTKIKVSGDSYMVAAGLPEPREDHAVVLTRLALELQAIANSVPDFRFRIGIHSGAAVAGVIGKKIFLYDLWGDTVNTASRMESTGESGRVNVSGETYRRIKDVFRCSYRGKVLVKDKGEIDMYFVDGPAAGRG